MKSLMYLLAILIFAANTPFVGADDLEAKSFPVSKFSEIENRTPGLVKLIQGVETSVVAETKGELIELLEVKTEDGKLILAIDQKKNSLFKRLIGPFGNERLRFVVTTPTINAISLHASGGLESETLKTDSLTIAIHGSGNINIKNIEAADDIGLGIFGSGEIEVGKAVASSTKSSIHGSGEVTLGALQTESIQLSIHGSGDIKVKELQGQRLDFGIHGSGDIRLPKVSLETIEGSVHGSGDVRLGGKASSVNVQTNGSGAVSTEELDAAKIFIK